jgi:hypothetical protein
MRRKLYIINNGMKDLRGHYYETSVSIAEASRAAGLQPILAAHVKCPGDIVPPGLEFYPALTTDHWMMEPPPAQPDLAGLRCDRALLASNTINDLIDGRIGFKEYVEARFVRDAGSAAAGKPEINPRSTRPRRRTQIKRVAKAILPPVLLKGRHLVKPALRQLTPPIAWDHLKTLLAMTRRPDDHSGSASSSPHRSEVLLTRAGTPQEYAYSQRFQQDLERLLCLTGCTAADHVFLPTAHGRELCAIQELLSRWPVGSRPTFHLEFRHSLALGGDGALTETDNYCVANATFFEIARAVPFNENIRLYTDSQGLAEEYERFSGLEFGVLPIPFRTRLLADRSRAEGPLCLGYYGDVRDEKGFHWLPDLVEALMDDHVRTRRVRFLIQASLIHPESEPRSKRALELLKSYPDDMVRLVGLGGPLSPDSYYQLVNEADLLLCPYHPATYRSRTSGTLAEAIASGIPTVVPHGSWLASQQPSGSGRTFLDRDSFIESVRMICDDYSSYHSQARCGRFSWLERHSPERLVCTLLGSAQQQDACDQNVA